ncbi:MAG: beta-aspartyl-peptidase [Bacteroidota bacterium]
MMILLKNGEIYNPAPKGVHDLLIAGEKIIAIGKNLTMPPVLEVETLDCRGLKIVPGLIDAHVHIAGAGGEGGPASRTPEMTLGMMIEAGITTVVGCLGTDGFARDLSSVLMKCKALKAQGVSAYMYTGAYQVPPPTITGDVGRDLTWIDEVIGVGEIALSDHRSSVPTTAELIRLAAHARVGGMLGGKAGIVNIHMGDAIDPFKPIYDAVQASELKFTQFYPTHCNRNNYIFEDAKKYGLKGYVDLTSSSYPYYPQYEIKPSRAVTELLAAGVPLKHITMTSDACGSLPDFDEDGNLVQLDMGLPKSLTQEIKDMILEEKLPWESALSIVTSNVADILKLKNKGRIQAGMDADLLVVDHEWNIRHMIARGALVIHQGEMIKKGNYEG